MEEPAAWEVATNVIKIIADHPAALKEYFSLLSMPHGRVPWVDGNELVGGVREGFGVSVAGCTGAPQRLHGREGLAANTLQ